MRIAPNFKQTVCIVVIVLLVLLGRLSYVAFAAGEQCQMDADCPPEEKCVHVKRDYPMGVCIPTRRY